MTTFISSSALLLLSCGINNTTTQHSSTDMKQSAPQKLRFATFNVSMEALNYVPYVRGKEAHVTGNELTKALQSGRQQIKNIAEIIQRINPDVLLLNEFDRTNNDHTNLKMFIKNYLNESQMGQKAIDFPYFYQGAVNTGVLVNSDLNHDNKVNQRPSDTHGFGHFEGHFGMVLLSKYPLDTKNIRTFQQFKWHDMPNALAPVDPITKQPWYTEAAWQELRLSSKSHWDIPVNVNGKIIHVLTSHPTPPVFDGKEDRNGKRNHDEIRFWHDYINGKQGCYIYDDNQHKGGLEPQQRFVIMGDQNASSVEGGAMKSGISLLLNESKIQDAKPESEGGKQHLPANINAINHTAFWGMRADYILPSSNGFMLKDSGIFWPLADNEAFRLIKNRQASSDHRLVWVDVIVTSLP